MGSQASQVSGLSAMGTVPVLLPVLGSAAAGSTVSSSSGADPEIMKRIKHTTDQLIARWKKKEFEVKHVEIWTRAAQGSSAAVAKAAVGGICHTFLLIETGPSTFLLERLVEGVRFVTLTDEAVEENKKWAKRMHLADNMTISSKDIAKW
eukprot:CAMPEP_0201592130 /NCGR_PEP_ID=MMETSP0190_2-20130828/190108_1 /ASSEMBLY_ACC=CAM_ASM_000263 /TAXON_ID=37353 /ORGANISM="Rosalina sp." /LENGTH=149 /DNA_ID=CAMNT_0048050755 /DNA_START=449 /DNA_END=895 /DNA_ORIENTATION=+